MIKIEGPYLVKTRSDGARLFGNFLRKTRKAHNLSSNFLAQKAGISESFVTGIERGDQAPSLDVAKRLLSGLNYSGLFEWVTESEYDLLISDIRTRNNPTALKFRSTVRGRGSKDNPKEDSLPKNASSLHDEDIRLSCLTQAVALSPRMVSVNEIIEKARQFETYIKCG